MKLFGTDDRWILRALLVAVLFPLVGIGICAQDDRVPTLDEVSKTRDVYKSFRDLHARNITLKDLDESEMIVVGRIARVQSANGPYTLTTDIDIEIIDRVRDFDSRVPDDWWDLGSAALRYRPIVPKASNLRVRLSGGEMVLNGRKVVDHVDGFDHLKEGEAYLMFLEWDSGVGTMRFVGDLAGVFRLLGENKRVLPIISRIRDGSVASTLVESEINIREFVPQFKKT